MYRREFLRAAAGIGAIGGMGCSSPEQAGPERELSISVTDHISLAPLYLAEEKGYLRDAGIRLNKLRLRGTQAVPLLAGGKLDIAFGGLGATLTNAVARGMNVKVVAGRETANPDCGGAFTLYSHRGVFDGDTIDPKLLRGRRFSVRKYGVTDFVLNAFLKHTGLSRDEVECVDLTLQESIAALTDRKVDAIFELEFSRSLLSFSPDIVKVWSLAEALPGQQYSFALFGETMLNETPRLGARFLAAYLYGAQKFLEGETPDFMREFAEKHGLDVERTLTACRETYPPDGAIDLPSVQRIIDWQVENGLVTQALEASQLVETSFVSEARSLLANGRWRVGGGES